jgi:imidazolonepropionase-like amidohydrolase
MEKVIAIKCGTLIDGTGNEPIEDAVVLIEDSKIIEVGEKLTTPQDAEVVNAGGMTVMSGLIDGHVHLNADPGKTPLEQLLPPDALTNLRAAKNARKTLEAGYTSILGNCGYGYYADLFLREAVEKGWIPGPRLWSSGPAITSTLRRGIYTKYLITPGSHEFGDGVEEMRKLVRRHIASGVDWIKVLATYAVGSTNGEPTLMNLNAEELEVIVEEAHSQRKKVKVHLEGRRTTKNALKAGIDIVLHGFFLDEGDVELMKRRNVPLMPTLAWRGELVRTGAPGMPSWYLKKAEAYESSHLNSFRRANEAGVLIAAGSDSSGGGSSGDFLRHGENSKELEYLVENGLTPMEALMAGTKNVAIAFGLSQFIGTVEVGKRADIILVDGNPLKDITILQDISKASRCPALQPHPPGLFTEET